VQLPAGVEQRPLRSDDQRRRHRRRRR
jgi:hypothetical protein